MHCWDFDREYAEMTATNMPKLSGQLSGVKVDECCAVVHKISFTQIFTWFEYSYHIFGNIKQILFV
jgi:hypothetical protein